AQFPGRIDELAIYREALAPERVKAHAAREGAMPVLKVVASDKTLVKSEALPLPPAVVTMDELPRGTVRVEVFEFPGKAAPDADAAARSQGSPGKAEQRRPAARPPGGMFGRRQGNPTGDWGTFCRDLEGCLRLLRDRSRGETG